MSRKDDVRKGFLIRVNVHTPALNERTPEDIQFCIAHALEQSAKPALMEQVDFTIEVSRIYEN